MGQRCGIVQDINQSAAYERINTNTYINKFFTKGIISNPVFYWEKYHMADAKSVILI